MLSFVPRMPKQLDQAQPPESNTVNAAVPLKPFLRWAGGKRQLLPELLEAVKKIKFTTYREPFLGAGTLFFALQPESAVLSDANSHLVMCYKKIRECHACVWRHLTQHSRKNSESHYYKVRDEYNDTREASFAQAARFIYLNKTCFNGIFRVNQNDEFNVPYGWKVPPCLPSIEQLSRVSRALKRSVIKSASYKTALSKVGSGDFIYLDPPYPPLNDTAYFTHYTSERFGLGDQLNLATLFGELDKLGCTLLMSNANTPFVQRLYAPFAMKVLKVTRYLTCKAKHQVGELLISNFSLD